MSWRSRLWLPRLWPRGLAGQLIVALIGVLLVAQGIVVGISLRQEAQRFEQDTGKFLARRVALVANLLETTPHTLHRQILKVASAAGFRLRVRHLPPGLPPAPFFEAWLKPHLAAQGITGGVVVRLPGKVGKRGQRRELGGLVAVPVQIGQQNVWLTLAARRQGPPPWPGVAFMSLVLASAGSALVIVLLVRRAMRPLQTLSSAAEQLGRGETVPPLEERGPSDIRTTIAAFNQMQWRLQRFVTDRTQMLAAISHDLRSPITALRLRAAMVDHDDTRERMIASLNDMQAMMEATLTFTREDSANEATELADLTSLITDAVTARQEQGHSVQWSPPAPLPYPCRPLALKRSIGNLIDNAVRYGGEATVQLDGTDIIVRDKGPGIPEAQLAYVFEAFTRLEASRNAATGGTGLGLAIARSIMRSHGGDVIPRNLPTGGLEARMNLPSAD